MGLGDNLACNAELGLSLGRPENSADLDYHHRNHKKRRHLKLYDQLLSSDLTLGPSSDEAPDQPKWTSISISSSLSGGGGGAVSSFSNSSSTFKLDELRPDQEVEEIFEDQADQATGSPRKKLRLTRDQSATLEDSFKQHTTLNPKQKQELASDLNLQPRQVEVWFQNRRARTKLKQTEANCEMLKKCCENLKEENTRLKQVVQELKAMKQTSTTAPFYMQFPTATLTVCPSCTERICNGTGASSTSENQNGNGSKPRLLISSFTHPSKAC